MNAIELNHACTYATPEEVNWLTAWAKAQTYYVRTVMIGAGPGVMALAIFDAGNLDNTPVTVIDIQSTEWVEKHTAHIHGKELTTITADSTTFRWHGGNDPIHLLIVDGNHTYEGVKADLDHWLPWVVKGGLVFLHDYDADGTCFAGVERYPGVKQAIEECSAHWEEYARVGTAMVMKVL